MDMLIQAIIAYIGFGLGTVLLAYAFYIVYNEIQVWRKDNDDGGKED